MSSQRSVKPLSLELSDGPVLAAFLVTIHLLAAAAAALLPFPWYTVVVLWLGLAINLARNLGVWPWSPSDRNVTAVRVDGDGGWQVRAGGDWHRAELRPDTYVCRLWVVLRFRLSSGRRCSAVITPDRIDRIGFRHLRVALKVGAFSPTASSDSADGLDT